MNPGEEFEIKACKYLNDKYSNSYLKFNHVGGMNSTKSDIDVIKNNQYLFSIEVKDSSAQSGQFVVLPNEENKSFNFSNKNKSKPNNITKAIIDYMNNNFDKFYNAGTKGEQIIMDTSIFEKWIITHYKSKNVKYIITNSKDGNFVILPIDNFGKYFSISASYRMKKSGSQKLAKKYINYVEKYLDENFGNYEKIVNDEGFLIKLSDSVINHRFQIDNHTFYFSPKGNGKFEIRTLSNTQNLNVIFSINIKKSQETSDLLLFESEL